ncbi:MAG: MarR family transcriptional regulator [Candidatus Anstonellales archaeon]
MDGLNIRLIGISLMVFAILIVLIVISLTQQFSKAMDIECAAVCGPHEETCPHAKGIPLESYVGFTISLILFLVGLYLISVHKTKLVEATEKEKRVKGILSTLKDEENKIYDLIKECGGAVFQSEIVEKTGYTKVRVTRALDRLESRGLVERRRRGMTNIVVLK